MSAGIVAAPDAEIRVERAAAAALSGRSPKTTTSASPKVQYLWSSLPPTLANSASIDCLRLAAPSLRSPCSPSRVYDARNR